MSRPTADLILTDAHDEPVAVVEVKRWETAEAGERVRHLMRRFGVPYGVLLTPEVLDVYAAGEEGPERNDAGPLLGPLLEGAGVAGRDLSGVAMAMLGDLFAGDLVDGRVAGPIGPRLSALRGAVAGGRVHFAHAPRMAFAA